MDRRKFLRDVFLWSAGITMQVPLFDVTASFAQKNQAELVAATGTSYELLARKAIETLGIQNSFVTRGDKVVIKPNIGWDRTPEQGANTHPIIIKSLVEIALDAGAAEILIFDHTCNEKRRCYVNSGIQKTIDDFGDRRVQLAHIDERKFVPVDIRKGKSLTRWDIYRDALEADVYINVPVAKHHGLSRLTLGLKNSMGVIGGRRGSLHFNLGQKLADLATVVQPQLTIIDATRMLLRNGPQGGDIRDVKVSDTLIASTDPVAADAYATTLFGLRPDEIDSTVAAYKMGLGEMDLTKMRIHHIQT